MNPAKWSRQKWIRRLMIPVLMITGCCALGQLDSLEQGSENQERLYFPSGKFLREASCGFREMVADFLWFETIQYYGGFRKGEHDLRYFDVLIDSVTELDPKFYEAFYFASLVKGLDFGRIDEAVDILRRGILSNPDNASLHFNIGFMYYVFQKDYARASVWFDAAARTPTATDFERRFAAYSKTRAGKLEASLDLWKNLHRTTISPEVRDLAQRMIEQCEIKLEEPQHGRESTMP
jgi:tetratricopeptide (TPR) repeat protein